MFIDRATIELHAGDGGDGVTSFRREPYVPRGGPDGGDGGAGGDIIIRATTERTTLHEVAQRTIYRAEDGDPGRGKKMTGKSGEDVVILVPCGTVVRDADTGDRIRDLRDPGQDVVAARGGEGGRGNARFATATNQAPRRSDPGESGEEVRVRLDLKLLADVGLIGKPNAGKSTLLARVSSARPRVAAYPFTTVEPVLGIVDLGDYRTMVVADIPGLIEGAHEGQGLGDEFLRHVERTEILVHLIDCAPMDETDPVEAYRVVREEIGAYDPSLADRPEIVCGSKIDLPEAADGLERLREELDRDVLGISAVSGEGIPELLGACRRHVEEARGSRPVAEG